VLPAESSKVLNAMALGVEINHKQFSDHACGHTDHRFGPSRPPRMDGGLICGRILEPMLGERLLRAGIAGEDRKAAPGKGEGSQEYRPARSFNVNAVDGGRHR
jgi:hypothetical protein